MKWKSAILRGSGESICCKWQQGTPPQACWISVITLLEIRQGIAHVEGKDEWFSKVLERWLEERVKPTFKTRTLTVTPPVAERAGRIAAIRTRGLADCLIAATALEHHLTLVTRNVVDFEDLGLETINPWEDQGNEEFVCKIGP